jgi:hypothetical protein
MLFPPGLDCSRWVPVIVPRCSHAREDFNALRGENSVRVFVDSSPRYLCKRRRL